MLDVIVEALLDTAKMLPFLFGAYLLIEVLETKTSDKLRHRLAHLGPLGPIGGAVLGVIPQCGFSVSAANLFAGRIISIGTLLAVFLSTSDEAIPILLSHPTEFGRLWILIALKVGIGIVVGLSADGIWWLTRHKRAVTAEGVSVPVQEDHHEHGHHHKQEEHHPHPHTETGCDGDCDEKDSCGCHGKHRNIWLSASLHTVQIGLFVLAVNLVLGFAMFYIGEDMLSTILLKDTIFQPFLAGLIGLIPNCAASVLVTELFCEGAISFGSCLAGLCTGAGVGLAVLFRTNRPVWQSFAITGVLYGVSVAAGLVIDCLIG